MWLDFWLEIYDSFIQAPIHFISSLIAELYNWILNWKLNHRITHQCWSNQVYKLYLKQPSWRRLKHSKGTTLSTTNERALSRRSKSLQNNMIKRYTFASMTKRPARSLNTHLTPWSLTLIKLTLSYRKRSRLRKSNPPQHPKTLVASRTLTKHSMWSKNRTNLQLNPRRSPTHPHQAPLTSSLKIKPTWKSTTLWT